MVRLLNAIGVPRGPKARAGESTRGVIPPLVRGVWGISPKKNVEFNISVEAILMHFETVFACKIRLIVQAFHVAVFTKCVSNPYHYRLNNYFDSSSLERLFLLCIHVR